MKIQEGKERKQLLKSQGEDNHARSQGNSIEVKVCKSTLRENAPLVGIAGAFQGECSSVF